jgi:hypothetical protein
MWITLAFTGIRTDFRQSRIAHESEKLPPGNTMPQGGRGQPKSFMNVWFSEIRRASGTDYVRPYATL